MIRVSRKRGFTMVEMLLALLILSVAVVFVVLVVSTVTVTRDAAYESIAFRIADAKLNELRAAGYAALPSDGPFSDPQLADMPSGAASTTVTVWNVEIKKVVAGVSWQEAGSAVQYISLTTLIAQSGGL